jgi:hypothetical protein
LAIQVKELMVERLPMMKSEMANLPKVLPECLNHRPCPSDKSPVEERRENCRYGELLRKVSS